MLRRSWYRTLRSAEVGPGAIVPATVARARVLVARLENGRAVAFARHCPHQDTDLGDATVVDGSIRCPRHEYLYDAVTGENVACNQDEVLVSIVCASGSPDGARCPSGGNVTALCLRK